MKKNLKVALLSTLAVAGVATIASCSKPATTSTTGSQPASQPTSQPTSTSRYDGKGATLRVAIDYQSGSKVSGVSYQMKDSVTLAYGDNTVLTKDVTLPTWKAFGSKLNLDIKDGQDYSKEMKDIWQQYDSDGYKDANGNLLDLVMGDSKTYNTAIANNKLEAISDHINEMPNFKRWTEENASIYSSMRATDGKVYYTPYFDGLDDIEKMNLMNIDYIEKLLDSDENQLSTDKTPSSKQAFAYQPTVADQASAKVTISYKGGRTNFNANFSADNNAVKKQNELDVKNGKTLVQALKAALKAEYAAALPQSLGGTASAADAKFTKLSEIFTSESACYNVDDLVALLRAVKYNSTFLTGDATKNITPVVPRTAQNNRTYQIAEMAAWWGVRGLSGENGKLYFDTNEELQDACGQVKTYTVLEYLNTLYNEGLIQENLYTNGGSDMSSTEFRKAGIQNGTVFMVYDYNATTTQYNKDVVSANKINLTAVLPPVQNWTGTKKLDYHTEDSAKGWSVDGYVHFTEDNRALKSGGWAIPKTSQNKASALALMDYLFSEEGARIQDYGPDSTYAANATVSIKDSKSKEVVKTFNVKAGDRVYWNVPNGSVIQGGEDCPVISDVIKAAVQYSGYTWNDYYRIFIGSTQGIGHVRSSGLDYQCTFSQQGRDGLNKLETAIANGSFLLACTTFEDDTNKFFNSVPSQINIDATTQTQLDKDTVVKTVNNFWNNGQSKVVWTGARFICGGWTESNVVAVVTSKDAYLSSLSTYNEVYVTAYRTGLRNMGI